VRSAGLAKVPGGELGHFSRADDHDCTIRKRSENLSRELDRGVADRDSHLADTGFRADPLGDAEGAREQAVHPSADRTARLCSSISGLHLAENLGLAEDHGIETGGDAEQVVNGLAALISEEVWADGV